MVRLTLTIACYVANDAEAVAVTDTFAEGAKMLHDAGMPVAMVAACVPCHADGSTIDTAPVQSSSKTAN